MSNVKHLVERQLSRRQLDLLGMASKLASERRFLLFLVGGPVRDILLGGRPVDLDLMVSNRGANFPSELADALGGKVVARSEFGTAKLTVGGIEIDLATARKETYKQPGALPTVAPGSVEEDLARRDFTINAMAVSLMEREFGELLDPFHGQQSLKCRIISVLHPNSFIDDATRILRAVRYAQRYGFQLEEETERLLRRDVGYLNTISGDRVRREMERIFREPLAVDMLEAAQQLGILSAIHPALTIEPGVLARFRACTVEPGLEIDLRFLTLLVYSLPTSQHGGLIIRLQMDARWARVVRDVGSVRGSFPTLRQQGVRPSRIHGLLHGLDEAAIQGCAIAAEPPVKQRLELYLSELRHVRPLLDGNDLLALGVPQGPMVGKLLGELLTARLDGLLSTREQEEALVMRSIGKNV